MKKITMTFINFQGSVEQTLTGIKFANNNIMQYFWFEETTNMIPGLEVAIENPFKSQ
jgi:hypothetical protein